MFSRDTTPFELILLLIVGIESIVAFLGNGFIIVVNGHRWLRSRKMLPSDLLLTALGTTRFLLQLVVITYECLYIYSSEFRCDYSYLRKSFFYIWLYFSSASVWCATWLCVFYCVKITNFAHCLFLWLKPRIDVLMPKLLGLSLTVFSLPLVVGSMRIMNNCIPTANMTGNTSQEGDSVKYLFEFFIPLQFTFIVINVSICLTASILLFLSLWRHTRNLKRSGITSKDFNTQAHINVVNYLISFLFFYILYAAFLTISVNNSPKYEFVERMVVKIVLGLSPSAHSIIIILTNPKLKEICVQILNPGKVAS